MKIIGLVLTITLSAILLSACASFEPSEDNIGDYDMGTSRFDMDAE